MLNILFNFVASTDLETLIFDDWKKLEALDPALIEELVAKTGNF